MARLPPALRRRSSALRLTAVLGTVLVFGGTGAAVVAALRPGLIPVGHGVASEAVSGAGLALGIGIALVGALHLAVAATGMDSRAVSAGGAVGAATLAVALLMGALSALVSAALLLLPVLLLGVAAYAWITVVLGAPDDGSTSDRGS
jgi:hypothetical protein